MEGRDEKEEGEGKGGREGKNRRMIQTANITHTHTHTHTECLFVVEQMQIQKIRTNEFPHSSLSGARLLSVTRSSINTSRTEQRCWQSRQRK